jgi:hypothetical protein
VLPEYIGLPFRGWTHIYGVQPLGVTPLLRQYFPKGTDLSRWSATDLEADALAINNRPRKVLGWKTPAEVFEEQLRSIQQPGVALTG